MGCVYIWLTLHDRKERSFVNETLCAACIAGIHLLVSSMQQPRPRDMLLLLLLLLLLLHESDMRLHLR